MNTQEFLQSGGRIVRRREGRRVITIAYHYQQKGDLILYGATIFQKERPTEQWSKAGQRQIAIDRLIWSPVVVQVARNFESMSMRERDHFVRKCLLVHGCQSVQMSAKAQAHLNAWARRRPPEIILSEFLDETFDAATQEEIQVELERARSAGRQTGRGDQHRD